MKKISVIIPVYNTEEYLERCINSVLNQEFQDLEIILVNDGSTDSSAEICNSYACKYNKISVFHKANGGSSEARNMGIENATGEYITFVDSDDYIKPDMYKKLYNNAKIYNSDITGYDEKVNRIIIHTEDLLMRYFLKGEVSVCKRIFSIKLFDDFRFKTGVTSEDVLASYQLFSKAKKYLEIPGDYYIIETGNISVSRSKFRKSDLAAIELTEIVANMCRLENEKYYKYARLHVYKAIFNIVNKSIIYGFESYEDEVYMMTNKNKFRKVLLKNLFSILATKYFSIRDKVQILTLTCSYNLFVRLKSYHFNKLANKGGGK